MTKNNEMQPGAAKQTMTSREIAELTGKPHYNVLKAIRAMEPAWQRTTSKKFLLVDYETITANGAKKKNPEYQLTKTECLYVATKFNDEARAKLVLRWEKLETERQNPFGRYLVDAQQTLHEVKLPMTMQRIGAIMHNHPTEIACINGRWLITEDYAKYLANRVQTEAYRLAFRYRKNDMKKGQLRLW